MSTEAIAQAEKFANAAFNYATENLVKECQRELAEMQNRLAARGIALSGTAVSEAARINGARIKKMVQARLEAFLEGYELYNVPVDDVLTTHLINNLLALRGTWAKGAGENAPIASEHLNLKGAYAQMVESESMVSESFLIVQIERRRKMPKKTENDSGRVTNVYHVTGEGARFNMNSTDNSVNVITTSNDQIFATMKAEIASELPSDEQNEIIEKLTLLELAQNSPSFGQRYTEFILAAANHMTLVAPFIPALTEMMRKTLS